MEENNNLTAERSLEIITEQIAQSRKTVMGFSICSMLRYLLLYMV